jgi:hypothetical protein
MALRNARFESQPLRCIMVKILEHEHDYCAAMKQEHGALFSAAWDLVDVARRTVNLMLALKEELAEVIARFVPADVQNP